MPDVIKVKLPEEGDFQPGQELEFPLESVQLPETVKTLKQVREEWMPKGNVQATIEQRLQQQAVNLRNELQTDDDFVHDILIAKGVPLNEDGEIQWPESAGFSPEDVQQKVRDQVELAKLQWEKRQLTPVQTELDGATSEIQSLRQKILFSEIMEAARQADVLDEKFEVLPGAPQSTAPVIQQVAFKFGFDPETKTWALKTPEGYQISTHDNPERPYAGPTEYFEMLKEDKNVRSKWFKDERPGGPDPGKTFDSSRSTTKPEDVPDAERRKQLVEMNNSYAPR